MDRVYRDGSGKLPDFSRLDRRPSRWRRFAIASTLVLLTTLAIAAWASFLIFKPYTSTTTGGATITIDAPSTSGIGSEITYRIAVTNEDRVPFASTTLDLRLPEHFQLADATPKPDDARGLRWSLGTIPARGRAVITVRGQLFGTPEQSATISADLLYRPGNFNAEFQSHARRETTLGASPIAITVDGPERTAPGQTVTYTVDYEHLGDRVLPPAELSIELPAVFSIATTSRPRIRTDELRFALGELKPNDRGTVSVTGSFTAGARESFTGRALVSLKLADEERPIIALQELRTGVLGGDVSIIATVNDQVSGLSVQPGERLRFRVAVRNDGDDTLRGLTIRAVFEATAVSERSVLDFAAIDDPLQGTAVGQQIAPGLRRGTVTWTATTTPALAALNPGAQHTIDLTLPVHTAASLPGFPPSARATLTAAMDIAQTGDVTQARTITAPPLTITVGTP